MRNIPNQSDNSFITESEWYEGNHPELEIPKNDEQCSESDEIVEDFFYYLTTLEDHNLSFEDSYLLDTTGDGDLELVHREINVEEGRCLVKNSIEKDGKLIWKDQKWIDEREAAMTLGKGIVNDFGPYALLYCGVLHLNFISHISEAKEQHLWNDRLKNAIPDISDNKPYIFELQDVNKRILTWDPIKERFVVVYSLDNSLFA